jgi:Tfp pilus assembly protein PilF
VFLLLDFWPLGRVPSSEFRHVERGKSSEFRHVERGKSSEFRHVERGKSSEFATWNVVKVPSRWKNLLLEKMPFFAIGMIVGWLGVRGQDEIGAMQNLGDFPFSGRLQNAILAYGQYLGQTFWPAKFSVFYPYPKAFSVAAVIGTLGLGLAISMGVMKAWRKLPYLLVGWWWYVITLFPAIGLIQIGRHARADRYMYVPMIGLLIIAGWALAELARRFPRKVMIIRAAAVACVAITIMLTRIHLGYWRTSETLFRHALAVTKNNAVAHNNLASALAEAGQLEGAQSHYQDALRIEPNATDVLNNLVMIHAKRGETAQAVERYEAALKLQPDYADVLNNLAWIRAANEQPEFRNGGEAVRLAQRACELTGNRKAIMIGTLAAAYAEAGQFADAAQTAERAVTVAETCGESEIAATNRRLAAEYRAGRKYSK